MSTRSAIGERKADGSIQAVYCHSDGYPSGVGQQLLETLREWGEGSEGRLLENLLSEKIGWSALCDRDLNLPATWTGYERNPDTAEYGYVLAIGESMTDATAKVALIAETMNRLLRAYEQNNQGFDNFAAWIVGYASDKSPRSYTARGEVLDAGQENNHFNNEAELVDSWCEWIYLLDLTTQEFLVYTPNSKTNELDFQTSIPFPAIHDESVNIDQLVRAMSLGVTWDSSAAVAPELETEE